MKAIIQEKYGDESALSLDNVELREIKEHEVLVEVHYLNISSGDMRINTLDVPKILKPILKLVFGWNGPRKKVRGITGSGIIKEVGSKVTNYEVGDNVYYINSMGASCGAEYVILNKSSIMTKISKESTLEQASPLAFGALTSVHFINENTVKAGDEVLINGASGSVGTYSIQIAKALGATVTGVSSERNHTVLNELGCDHVIDYKKIDFTKQNKKYDLVFDTVMTTKKLDVKKVLKPGGKYITTKAPSKESVERLHKVNEYVKNNGLKSYIEKVYSMNEYQEAFKHVYSKHKVGNVVIKIK